MNVRIRQPMAVMTTVIAEIQLVAIRVPVLQTSGLKEMARRVNVRLPVK